jgi:hypothetical protein
MCPSSTTMIAAQSWSRRRPRVQTTPGPKSHLKVPVSNPVEGVPDPRTDTWDILAWGLALLEAVRQMKSGQRGGRIERHFYGIAPASCQVGERYRKQLERRRPPKGRSGGHTALPAGPFCAVQQSISEINLSTGIDSVRWGSVQTNGASSRT